MEALTSLIHEDATQSMPPFDLWLSGRDDIFAWWVGPGAGCRGSRVIPTVAANGSPAFGQYKPSETGEGYEPWALQVLEISDGRIVELTFFLGTETIFPLFGLPPGSTRSLGSTSFEPAEDEQVSQLARGAGQPDLQAELGTRRASKSRERFARRGRRRRAKSTTRRRRAGARAIGRGHVREQTARRRENSSGGDR